jgi:hypothetical protein
MKRVKVTYFRVKLLMYVNLNNNVIMSDFFEADCKMSHYRRFANNF